MLRHAWKPALAATGLGGAAYLWYNRSKPETFDIQIRVRGPDGKATMATKPISIFAKEVIEASLKQHATQQSAQRGGIVWNHATASLPSNNPIEDANSSVLMKWDEVARASSGDLLFFTVMDGHGGYHTSRLLSKVLVPAVTLELKTLVEDPSAIVPKASTLKNLSSYFWPNSAVSSAPLSSHPKLVSAAIQKAFTNLDWELINAPLWILAASVQKGQKEVPDLSQHPMDMAVMQPALSGSCALMALFDATHKNLYVACTGDSRAVAGMWEVSDDGQGGSWKVDVLSEDQTGRNLNEVKRMQAEHPPNEAADVIRNGRVLGGLEPTRAFGDARYKWPREVQDLLNEAFMKGAGTPMRSPPPLLKTPPYVTSTPVVTHRPLSFLDASQPESSSKPKSTLRFLVLATDGLWDRLTSEEVVALVGGHLSGLKGDIAKSSLPVATVSGSSTVDGKEGKNLSREGKAGSWAFRDENISTHLIRNALGGADDLKINKLMSIPAPYSRNFRDDITVTVVWWEEAREKSEEGQVKAKL